MRCVVLTGRGGNEGCCPCIERADVRCVDWWFERRLTRCFKESEAQLDSPRLQRGATLTLCCCRCHISGSRKCNRPWCEFGTLWCPCERYCSSLIAINYGSLSRFFLWTIVQRRSSAVLRDAVDSSGHVASRASNGEGIGCTGHRRACPSYFGPLSPREPLLRPVYAENEKKQKETAKRQRF